VPEPVCPECFQIVKCVDQLNKKLGPKLTDHDINYIYNFQTNPKLDTSKFGWYLKGNHGPVRLISCIPDSNRQTNGSTSSSRETDSLIAFLALPVFVTQVRRVYLLFANF